MSKKNNQILELRNKFKGEEGFIVATGPSLAHRNMSFLKDKIKIGVNLSPLMFDQWGFLPDYNIIADKFIWPKFNAVLNKLLFNTDVKKIIIASACETFPKESIDFHTFFFEKKMPQEVIKFSENPIIDGFYRGKTVTYDALQFAFFLGLSKVYILGMDFTVNHNWGVNGHSYEIQRNPRFPDLEFPKSQDHMIQRGLPGNPHYNKLIKAFFSKAREHYEAAGRQLVIDETSNLDVLDKKKILI